MGCKTCGSKYFGNKYKGFCSAWCKARAPKKEIKPLDVVVLDDLQVTRDLVKLEQLLAENKMFAVKIEKRIKELTDIVAAIKYNKKIIVKINSVDRKSPFKNIVIKKSLVKKSARSVKYITRKYSRTNRDGIIAAKENKCEICENKSNLCIHHIIPLSAGGKDIESNLLVCCLNCHRALHPNLPDCLFKA